ncbi:hypothetical protein IQ215_04030 [Cyanobacterium stanieri LEGE 03274]|uniref:Uncharacterized protein n=1 Tax=Cyanobacterium stanieri LEGE 03274 TaxID=1828756 RepID=A0ABR9V1U6_9CHRO|nr:hypothetical protein [Cyanobacterium stanieri]MBE9221858.1 hypothetical protein [Cyanobacterium stanieri LEGE 03274]
MIIRIVLVWILIAIIETIQGIVRVKFVSRKIGEPLAKKIGIVSGCFFIFLITWFTFSWIKPMNIFDSLLVGLLWLILMVVFDILLGRYIFHYSWKRIGYDFNIYRGGFLGIGMMFLFFAPTLVFVLR